ncbi:MAG: prepilin-type N-terminal cleavage/methylation domain-containing protein [Clostridiales bacterium]|nr:prepilin-type N-terminal cleavage/methylation domain-containing protein [Clostridiales bacterium]
MNRSAGLTLIEVLVAIFILALIAGSFLTSYGFAHKHNTKAETVLMASFIAQTKMEALQSMDALSAYRQGRGHMVQDDSGCYIQTLCQPYLSDDYHLFSLVLKDKTGDGQGYMLYAVPPEGKDVLLIDNIVKDTIVNLSIANESFSMEVQGSGQLINGSLTNGGRKIMVMINAVGYSGNHHMTFHINPVGRTVEARVYDTGGNSNKLTILGVSEQRFTDYVYRNYSMIRAVVSVFADDTDTQPVAVFESIFQLEN